MKYLAIWLVAESACILTGLRCVLQPRLGQTRIPQLLCVYLFFVVFWAARTTAGWRRSSRGSLRQARHLRFAGWIGGINSVINLFYF
jgi:hypothetical protein